MKILIVGGGVAGPALAQLLKDHADVTLIEKAPQWGNIGFTISLWGIGVKILRELGVGDTILRESTELPWIILYSKKRKILQQLTSEVFSAYGASVVVPRAVVQKALIEKIENTSVHIKPGTTIGAMTQKKGGVDVTLSDGTTETFDLVVGADGARSHTREMVFGKGFLKYYGWRLYAYWLPPQTEPPHGIIQVLGAGRSFIIYPHKERTVAVMAVATPREQIGKRDEHPKAVLQKAFADFDDEVKHMIDGFDDSAPIFQDDAVHVDMRAWYRGRVVLIGDARHATSPVAGMGTTMALEDAFVLAEELKNNTADIDQALRQFAKRRQFRIEGFRSFSALLERSTFVRSSFFIWMRDMIMPLLPGNYFINRTIKVLAARI